MREVKEPSGPGHDGAGSVVVPPFYAQQKHPLVPPHSLAHQQPPPPHQQQRPGGAAAAPAHQQPVAAMRGSPAPPPVGANPPPSHAPHSPHIPSGVGGPGNMMPNHPNSGQNDNRNSVHSAGYPPNPPPHMSPGPPGPHGYPGSKMHVQPGSPYGQPAYQHGPGGHQFNPTRPQSHMMQGYPQGYPPGGPQAPPQGPPSSMPPGHQYTPRPPPHNSHVSPNQPYGYPHYPQQPWPQSMGQGPPPTSGMPGGPTMIGGKGSSQIPGQPTQPGANNVGGPRPHTPPHYHKPHLTHKMSNFPTSGPTQMFPNGPGMSPAIMNSRESPQNSMPPPTSTPQPIPPMSSSADGDHNSSPSAPVTSASSTVNSNSNNIGSSSSNSVLNNSNPPQIGPDGNPLVDEASQQSTVSNTSAASDETTSTPKSHKEGIMGSVPMGGIGSSGGGIISGLGGPHPPSHPPTPVNSAPSPGTASMTSQPDEFENMNSPGWPRSPSGPPPTFNSQPHPPQEVYRAKPGDSIMRLYEMSDSPERKGWLDKLLRFMEDNKTPITTCPTISKNPLDLYALYLHVRERGGFEEVTKNKQWKDVAAVMGIGASSSGSYTLRRHYMKHILYYECKFDRGGIDPQPIINQIESTQKKKTQKIPSVPSPGSSNSQDSFPPPGSNSSSMDGFANGPHMSSGPGMTGPYSQYPPSSEYPGHMQQRPPVSQSAPGFQGYGGNQYPGYQGMHGGYGQPGYPNAGYPPERVGYQPPGPPNHHGSYPGYQGSYQRPNYPPPPPPQQGFPQDHYTIGSSGPANNYGNSHLAKQLLNPPRNPGAMQGYPGSNMYPPQKPGTVPSPGPQPPNSVANFQGPKRHPDFEKNQPNWRPPNGQFGGYVNQAQPPVQSSWPRPPSESGPPTGPPQWNPSRYPSPPTQNFPNQPRWPGNSFSANVPPRSQGPVIGTKNYSAPQVTSFKSVGYGAYMGKQLFPMDSVEAVSPVLYKRRRMCRTDVQPVDPWKLLMSLRCGMASEVTWALDVLNILLFDDQTIIYFCLHHMPGLLETLIEHLRRGLINMFDICSDLELGRDDEATGANKRIKAEQHDSEHPWYARPPPSPSLDLDLGKLEEEHDPHDKEIYIKGPDYSAISRTGKPVRIVKREAKLFMKEGSREWDKWEGFDSGVDTWSVGGGECTAHIICSMQSSVPTLPFTRLLPDKSATTVQEEKVIVKSEAKEIICSEIAVKIERLDTQKLVKDLKSDRTKVIEKSPKKIENSPSKGQETSNAKKDSSNKNGSGKPAAVVSKFNRKNNSKTLKLDDIVKRIKKEPIDASCDTMFNKSNKDKTDSKSILDHYLKKNQVNESESQQSDSSCKAPSSVEQTCEKLPSLPFKTETKSLLKPPETKITTKSPSKLLSISPIKLSDKASDRNTKRDSIGFKRPYDDLEEESWGPDEASLSTTTEGQDWLARRVIGVGTVIRNLSFVPGNEELMSKSASLLALLGKTILLHHEHPQRSPSTSQYDRDEEIDFSDWCSSLAPDTYWWWPYLHHVHENTLVTLTNIAGHLDLSYYPEEISRPILNGLLHWATCPASYGQDPLAGSGYAAGTSQSALSPQRLALEALVKLCVLDPNTDLVLATPPFSRLDMLCSNLTRLLCRGEDQVLREFALNLFNYFSAADSGVARVIAMQNGCVSLLVAFIEEAESAALAVANLQGVGALKENPELMGTSLDMVRRSAHTLVNLSRVPDNARVITTCENRLLTLVMSQILDTYVASQLSQVLFNVAQVQNENSMLSLVNERILEKCEKGNAILSHAETDRSSSPLPNNKGINNEAKLVEEENKKEETMSEESPKSQDKCTVNGTNKEPEKDTTTPSDSKNSNSSEIKSSVPEKPASQNAQTNLISTSVNSSSLSHTVTSHSSSPTSNTFSDSTSTTTTTIPNSNKCDETPNTKSVPGTVRRKISSSAS